MIIIQYNIKVRKSLAQIMSLCLKAVINYLIGTYLFNILWPTAYGEINIIHLYLVKKYNSINVKYKINDVILLLN